MKREQAYYYLSEKGKGVKRLLTTTNFSDIHRGIVFKTIESANEYYKKTFDTILDKGYFEDLFSNLPEEKLYSVTRKYKTYKQRIEYAKKILLKYDYDWNRIDKTNKDYMEKKIEMTLSRLDFQEQLAIVWENRTNRDFSPFTYHIFNELEGITNKTKDWPEAQEIIKSWQKIKPKFEKEIKNLENLYVFKIENLLDYEDKKVIFRYEEFLRKLKTEYYENKYKLALLTPDIKKCIPRVYTIENVPYNQITYDGYAYNLFIVQDNKIKRVRFIVQHNKTYKLFTTDGVLFNNNILLIVDNSIKGESANLKPYIPIYQTKTTEARKVKNLNED